MEDAIVIGGGVAGLAAATWLGRYRRRTLVLNDGDRRNSAARQSHGYLTRDGVSPNELIAAAHADLDRYVTVDSRSARVTALRRDGERFVVTADGVDIVAQRLVLATGVVDEVPDIAGFDELYGIAAFHCPCCDGFEAVDQHVLAIGWGEHTAGYALDLLDWGAKVTIVTDGREFEGGDNCLRVLDRHDVEVTQESVLELLRDGDRMLGGRLSNGATVDATMAFFTIAHHPRTELAEQLGCELDGDGYIAVGDHGETSVEGVYAVGDVTPGEQLVQTAAASGAVAGIACAMSLRGKATAPGAPDPGPHPEAELAAADG